MAYFPEISLLGEKYLDKEIENAINGVKEMKTVMERSDEDHKNFVDALEETKRQKEVRAETGRMGAGAAVNWAVMVAEPSEAWSDAALKHSEQAAYLFWMYLCL